MTVSMGYAPTNLQATAAIFNVDAVAKAPPEKRDDVVAPINTTNGEAAKADISLLKMSNPSVGQNVDMKV